MTAHPGSRSAASPRNQGRGLQLKSCTRRRRIRGVQKIPSRALQSGLPRAAFSRSSMERLFRSTGILAQDRLSSQPRWCLTSRNPPPLESRREEHVQIHQPLGSSLELGETHLYPSNQQSSYDNPAIRLEGVVPRGETGGVFGERSGSEHERHRGGPWRSSAAKS
jgi:hypothetical protein